MEKKNSKVLLYLKGVSKKDKIILTFTIIISVGAVMFKFLLLPQLTKYTDNINKLSMAQSEYSIAKVAEAKNTILKSDNETLKTQYTSAINEFPRTPEVAQITYDLEAMIRTSGVKLDSIVFESGKAEAEAEESNNPLDEIDRGVLGQDAPDLTVQSNSAITTENIDISISGSYKSVLDFIREIESYERIAEVSDISIDSGLDGSVNASITANFYNLNYSDDENYEFNEGSYGKENPFN